MRRTLLQHGQVCRRCRGSVEPLILLGQAAEKVEERSSTDCAKSFTFEKTSFAIDISHCDRISNTLPPSSVVRGRRAEPSAGYTKLDLIKGSIWIEIGWLERSKVV
jgi:hypothetical protein